MSFLGQAAICAAAGEGGCLVIGLAGEQAVVQAAEPTEQIPFGGWVAIAGVAAPVVVRVGAGTRYNAVSRPFS